MRIIDGYEIGKINIPPALALETVDKTLRAKYEDVLPPKISMPLPGHKFINVMPAIVPSLNAAGVKIVSRYPERSPSLRSQILLYDLRTGEPKALMDADLITSLRTAAVAVHSVRLLAKSGWSSVALIRLGDIGAHIADMLSAAVDREFELRLYDYKNRAADFAAKHCSGKGSWKIFGDYEEMVSDADVVISAVSYAEEDFAPASAYKKGVLVVPCIPAALWTAICISIKSYATTGRIFPNSDITASLKTGCRKLRRYCSVWRPGEKTTNKGY